MEVVVVVVVVVVVLTFTPHRDNKMRSLVAGQAPTTLEWKKYLGKEINQAKSSKHDN